MGCSMHPKSTKSSRETISSQAAHTTQNKGEAEREVQTVKSLLKEGDPYLTLLFEAPN